MLFLCILHTNHFIVKKVFALILLIAFTMQTFGRALVVIEYYTNTSAFAKNCINKARPRLHCNGKCQMMKKLKEEEKKQQDQSSHKMDVKDEVLSSKSFFTIIPAVTVMNKQYPVLPHTCLPLNEGRGLFHPPGLT